MKGYNISRVVIAMAVIGLVLSVGTVQAQELEESEGRRISIPLVGIGDGSGTVGELFIDTAEKLLLIVVRNAPANRSFNVFLTQNAGANRLPVSFIGSFTTNSAGRGRFKLEGLDVTKAFALFTTGAPTNPVTGETSCGAQGASVLGPCNVVQLNALRIYFADPGSATRSFDRDGTSGALLFAGVVFDTSD